MIENSMINNTSTKSARLDDWMQPVLEGGPVSVMQTPRSLEISITGKCNLHCKTCFYTDEMVALRNLPTSKWLAVFDELGTLSVMDVCISGGEPMTHPDILTLIDAIVKNRMRFTMLSNGTLFNKENAQYIKNTCRCNNIQVSIDGSCPEVHDKIRGKGAFNKAVRGIKILKEAGINVSARVTINRLNLKDLPNVFKFLFDDLKLKSVGTNEAFPRGSAHCNIKDLDMTPEERREAERICLESSEKYPALSAAAGPLALGRKLKKIKEDLKNPPKEKPRKGGFLRACNIAYNKLSILHDGKIVPCTQLPHMVLGQVGVDSIKDVWNDSVGLQYLRTRHRIPLGQLEECRDCKYQQYCTGGCPAVGYAVTGKMTGRNPRDCYRALLGEDPEYVF